MNQPLKSGNVIFVRGKSLLSWLIRLFDHGEFSHCAICLSDNGTSILESQYFTKSRIVQFYFKDYENVDLGLTDEQKTRIQEFGLDLIGYQYDFIQVFSYAIKDIFRKFKIINDSKKYICSEIVGILLQESGVIPKDENLSNLTPNELYRYLMKLQGGE